MKKERGSLTIYMTLVLLIVSALICTVVESGRMSAVYTRARSYTYMGLDSVFSEFALPMFSAYGIMGLWMSSDGLTEKFTDYVNGNLDHSDLPYSANAELYGMSLTDSQVLSAKMLTDDNGLIFAEQVYEYMQYYLAESAAEELLGEMNIFGQSDVVSEFTDQIQEYSEVFTNVEESVSEIKDKILEIKEITENPAELLDKLYEKAAGYTGDVESSGEFSSYLEELKGLKTELEEGLNEIKAKTDEYYQRAQEAKAAIEELQAGLTLDAEEQETEIYESIKEQIDELKEKSADTDRDYYGALENGELAEEMLEKVESLETLFSGIEGALSLGNSQGYVELIAQYQDMFAEFDLEALGVNLDIETVQEEDSGILDSISSMMDSGILAYVKEDISEKTVDTAEFPSVTEEISDSGDEDLALATIKKVTFSQYVITHFGNAVEASEAVEETGLDYEAEYILAGKDSDLENLKSVVGKIAGLRSGCNFVSILKDSEKKAEAEALAAAMVGFTGLPVLIKIFQLLILAAWSTAEAVTDVKTLLEGGKVPMIKESTEWNLSIEGFKNFNGSDIEGNSSEKGLEYEDYLRVLLVMQNTETQYFRTMDMIQANMCLNENEAFRIAGCIESVELTAEFTAGQIFTAIPFVKNIIGSSGSAYTFSITQNYGY